MQNRYFVKFCGITNTKDALIAQAVGCDAIGFVFVKKSKRFVEVEICKTIINSLSPNILTVALFANNSEQEVSHVLRHCNIHVLQFHGNETADFCKQWQRPYWKAIPMADGVNPIEYSKKYIDAVGYLIDNYGSEKSGGSGACFDWDQLPKNLDSKWILAGGLNPENIDQAKSLTHLNSFDVSSGIEESPGKKSETRMINFIKNLND